MKYAVPYLAQMFKGYSSRKIRDECWEYLQRVLWGESFWSDGYFHEYIGRFTNDAMRYYIERQQGKHWYDEDYDFHKHQQKKKKLELVDFM